MIDDYVQSDGLHGASKPRPSKLPPPAMAPTRRAKMPKLPSSIPDPPPPAGKKSGYGVGEFPKIMYAINPKKRRRMFLKMKSKQFGYLPILESSLYRFYEDFDRGERFDFDQEW